MLDSSREVWAGPWASVLSLPVMLRASPATSDEYPLPPSAEVAAPFPQALFPVTHCVCSRTLPGDRCSVSCLFRDLLVLQVSLSSPPLRAQWAGPVCPPPSPGASELGVVVARGLGVARGLCCFGLSPSQIGLS